MSLHPERIFPPPCVVLQVGQRQAVLGRTNGLFAGLLSPLGLATSDDRLQLDGMTRLATTMRQLSSEQVSG